MIPEQPSKLQGPVLTTQLIAGATVILVGIIFTLDNLDVLDARRYLPFWPLVILAVGIGNFIAARETPQRVFGGFLITVASLLLLGRWGVLSVRWWDLWPLLLVFWGGMIVWRGWYGVPFRMPSSVDARNAFSASAFLGGFDRVVSSDEFRGGEVYAFMGGGKLDLTRARLPNGAAAMVHVSALMGGMEIRIPHEWAVDNRVVYFMGGSDDRSRIPTDPDAPRLVLKGFVMMGGVEIKN